MTKQNWPNSVIPARETATFLPSPYLPHVNCHSASTYPVLKILISINFYILSKVNKYKHEPLM